MNNNERISIKMSQTKTYKPTVLTEQEDKNGGYVKFGKDNKYPEYIYDIYNNCATLQSIINGSSDYTFGEGVKLLNKPETLNAINSVGDSVNDVIGKVINDLWIFGGFAVQVIYDNWGNISEVVYLDFRNVRTNIDKSVIYYNDRWSSIHTNDYQEIAPFDLKTGREDKTQIYYYKGNRTRGVYPEPDYRAALVSAETQIQIQHFHHNSIINNFMVNGILNFNNANNVSDDVKDKIESAINTKFSGAENAANLMISWNEDKDKAVTFERLSDDQFDKKYEALANSTRDNLFISMRAIPVIFGLTVNTGFNTQEFKDAFALYNKTAIKPKQQIIERVFSEILGEIKIEPFKIEFEDESEVIYEE